MKEIQEAHLILGDESVMMTFGFHSVEWLEKINTYILILVSSLNKY